MIQESYGRVSSKMLQWLWHGLLVNFIPQTADLFEQICFIIFCLDSLETVLNEYILCCYDIWQFWSRYDRSRCILLFTEFEFSIASYHLVRDRMVLLHNVICWQKCMKSVHTFHYSPHIHCYDFHLSILLHTTQIGQCIMCRCKKKKQDEQLMR